MSDESNLNPGDSGPDVTDLQQRLHDLGYFDESPDGHYDDATVAAVHRFQEATGLDRTGSVDEHTLARIGRAEHEQAPEVDTQLSDDGYWRWDDTRWHPTDAALLADNSLVGATRSAPQPAAQTAQQATAQVSDDGQWWWDGTRWQPTGDLQLPTAEAVEGSNANVTSASTDTALTAFATGSAVLTAEHQAILATIAVDLNAHPLVFGGYVTLTGHADRRGDAAANRELGQQRADAVRAYLVQLLTDDATRQQIHAYSMGAPTDGPTGDVPELRKVEIEITRRTYNVNLGPDLTPPGSGTSAQSTPDTRSILDLRLPPDYGLPPQDPNQSNLPPDFWRALPSGPAQQPFIAQLSQVINRTLHTHDLARIGGDIAAWFHLDRGQVTNTLDQAFASGGEAAVKAILNAVIQQLAGPPAHAPDSPTGPAVNEVPTPPVIHTPQIPTP